MPNKRNRKDSESSSCSVSGPPEEQHSNSELLSTNGSGSEPGSDETEMAWLRPCCTPLGCVAGGQINLTEPDEIEKVICSNEGCSSGCYMHKECFSRWEDGLLTYLRSHGRARSWSEKQRRQNLWTKRGYDLAFRACACMCGRGHLRKDLNWNPKDVSLPGDSQSRVAEEAAKKKNRKKHKDLPSLGNKYTFAVARSKSKAIPMSGKDGRVRTSSSSSCLSTDQGYSSSTSPSNSEIHGPLGNGFFSPPQNNRGHLVNGARIIPSYRNPMSHGVSNHLFQHGTLPQIPDNDVLNDFGPGNMPHLTFCDPSSLFSHDFDSNVANQTKGFGMPSPQAEVAKSFPPPLQPDHQLQNLNKMMGDLSLPLRQHFDTWNLAMQSPPLQSPLAGNFGFDRDVYAGARMAAPVRPRLEGSKSLPGHSSLSSVLENPNVVDLGLPFIGHWNPSTPEPDEQPCRHVGKGRTESLEKITEQQSSLPPFRSFMENATTMLCSDIDLKKPKVVIIPSETVNQDGKKTCTEICITPMCNTTFHKRLDFSAFQNVLQPSQVNPYHIKMEGEGYGSDDFRNSVLTKLSRVNCSEMNCVTCGKMLFIYDHFPLVDGTLFLSPLRNEDRNPKELKIEIEHKNEYLHAVCVGCLDGANNLACVMCKSRWRVPFHQLGSLYMFDVFAAAPCCQRRLCCKRCGTCIVDRNVGMKYYSQYSAKTRCPGCGDTDYHFVHPASTFRALGPSNFSFF